MKTQLTTNPKIDPKELEAPRIHDTTMNEETQEEDREFEEPQEPVDPPQEKNPHKRKPTWVREAIQGVERYGAPKENHREKRGPGPASGIQLYYVSLSIKNLPTMKKRQNGKNGRIL